MSVGIIVFHIGYAMMGYPHYRDQHLGTALTYAREGVDLFKPIIVGFNANNAPTPQEFPLWQAAASLPMRWFGEWFGWANVVSLLLFATALYPVWRLGAQLGGSVVGWWATALLLSQPLVWLYAGAGATDGTSLATAVWFFFSGYQLLISPRKVLWVIATATTGALAATLKLPFMMAAGIGLGINLVAKHRDDLRAWLAMGASATFAALVFLLWTRYTDSCIAQAEFAYVELRTSHNPDMGRWYFGDWSYRLNPANWIKGGWRAMNALFGSFALLAVPMAVIGLRRASMMALAWLSGCLVVTGVFSNLVLHHTHYYLMYSPAVALLVAPLVSRGWTVLSGWWSWPKFTLLAGLLVVSLLSIMQGLLGLEVIQTDPYTHRVVNRIEKYTTDSDKLLIIRGGWGGEELFLSGRRGLSIWNTQFLEKGENLQRIRDLGYTKVVVISESPLLHALQVVNPGSAERVRMKYDSALTRVSQDWPVVHRDEDIVIKSIPTVTQHTQ